MALAIQESSFASTVLTANLLCRRDMSRYFAYTKGELSGQPTDLTDIPWENMTSFYYGCSFTFEAALIQAGIRMRHLDEGKDISLYRTDIQLCRNGIFECSMIVSMRPIHQQLLSRTVAITAAIPEAHGAPIHIGDPSRIGIADIAQPLYSKSVEIKANEVPVFWACGVSFNEVIPVIRPELAFTHTWTALFLSDIKYQPKQLQNIPEVVTISKDGESFFGSIISQRCIEKLSKLEQMILQDGHKPSHSNTNPTLLKATLVISHASKVAILLRDLESCSLLAVFAICQALLALEKQVVLITDDDNRESLETCATRMVSMGVLMSRIPTIPLSEVRSVGSTSTHPEFDCLVAFSVVRDLNVDVHIDLTSESIDTLNAEKILVSECRNAFKLDEVHLLKDHAFTTSFSNWGGYAISLGLYLISTCPLHWRYKNHGIGAESPPDLSVRQFLPSSENTVSVLKLLKDLGINGGCSGSQSSVVNGLPLEQHLKKLEELATLAL